MKKLIERWKALPKWQKFLATTVLVWVVVWAGIGTVAALVYGIGSLAGFLGGVVYQASQQ